MPKIILKNVTKRWGNFYGVENLNLVIDDNSFVTLLGPSGCGKTTTLRMIAGLDTPTSGLIMIGNDVVFDSNKGINIPANKRKVGFLFQNYALWPNMTVYNNIAFGLSNIKEKMPIILFDAKIPLRLSEILKNFKSIVDLVNDCKDKKGVIDKNKVCLKFIDSFEISMNTAKDLYSIYESIKDGNQNDADDKSKELIQKSNNIVKLHSEKGEEYNENFEMVKDGIVVQKLRKLTREEIDLKVRAVSRVVKVGMFMDRYPAELSGGQQQRVAIARTLAPEPSVLFMDEPLSNLDAKLRLEMRYELQRLHVETGSTFVYVTHDQMEAMTLATKICLINNGVLQMYDSPLSVYNRPKNLFVADFVGNPSINFVDAKGIETAKGRIHLSMFDGDEADFVFDNPIKLDSWFKDREDSIEKEKNERKERLADKSYVEKGNKDERFRYHIQKVVEEDDVLEKDYKPVDGDFVVGIRPEFIQISDQGHFEGIIYGAMPTGMESTIKIRMKDYLLTGVIFGSISYQIGTKIRFDVIGDKISLFDRSSERLVGIGSLKIE